ncbi:MAG: hypothetical protein JNM10_14995 [Planctomycetia bacterium]|nr:hypothetical protein [Planctomycetia bacterium]
MSGTLRNLRTTATAEVSNLEQGMRRAAAATRQVGTAAEESSRRGSRAMDDLGRRGGVSLGVVGKGAREASIGLLQLGDTAGATSSKVGGLLSGMVSGFAGGGLLGLGIGAVTGAIALLGSRSEETRKEQERLRAEQEKAAEQARDAAQKARDAAEQKAKDLQQIRDEIDLINARTEAERRGVEDRIASRKAGEKGPDYAKLEAQKQDAEARRRAREEENRAAEESAARSKRDAEAIAELNRRAAEAQKELTKRLEEQARREFEVMTLTAEQLKAKERAKLIQDLLTAGKKEEAEAIRQAIEYEKAVKGREDKAKEEKKAAEEARREQERQAEAHDRLAKAADEQVERLRNERALLAAGTEEIRKREERWQRVKEIMKEYGAEARKVLVEQQKLWAEEDARDAKKQADAQATASKGAKAKATKADSGRPSTSLDDYDPGSGMGPNAWRREQKKAQRQYDKNRHHVNNLRAEKRGMGISLDDWGGYFSWARSYDPDAKKRGGAGEDDQSGGPPAPPGGPNPNGDGPLVPPTYPSHPPAITPGDAAGPQSGGAQEAQQALDATATATKQAADSLGAIAPSAKEAADGARKTADAATGLDGPVKELATGLTDAAAGIDAVKASVGEAVTGVQQVVKVVNDLRGEMTKLKQALDQLGKAA